MSVEMVVKKKRKKGWQAACPCFSIIGRGLDHLFRGLVDEKAARKESTPPHPLWIRLRARAIRAASEHAAKRKSTGCALRLIVSPFTNKLSRVNPETREIIYTPACSLCSFPLSAWLFSFFEDYNSDPMEFSFVCVSTLPEDLSEVFVS